MKYIITGRNKGEMGSDSADPLIYIELGWEVMVNRLRAVNLLKTNIISEDDTVVTSVDRLFLYSKIFKNVISNESFESLNIAQEFVIDLTVPEEMLAYTKEPIWQPKYKYLDRDLDTLLKIDTSIVCNYDIDNPFVCISFNDFIIEHDLMDEEDQYILYPDYEQYLSECSFKEFPLSIRYDYAENSYNEGLHPVSHLHIGEGNNSRIGLIHKLDPESFVYLIIRQVYPEYWNEILNKG